MINYWHSILIIVVVAIVTMAIRFLPFILFPENKEVPGYLLYLSKVLPAAVMGMLVVYCFRNTEIIEAPHGIPEMIASAIVIASYIWKKNFLISIGVGTVAYMILIQMVFV